MSAKTKNEELLKLSEEILSDFDCNALSLELIISKCKKLARLRNDFDVLNWLTLELVGYEDKSLPHAIKKDDAEKFAHWSGRYTVRKALVPLPGLDVSTLPEPQKKLYEDQHWYYLQSVPQLEVLIRTSEDNLKTLVPPSEFTPSVDKQSWGEGSIMSAGSWETVKETYGDALQKIQNKKLEIQADISNKKSLLARIRDAVYTYVLRINYTLRFGNITETIFEQARNMVNQTFIEKCPEAIQQLIASYDRLASNNPEEWAQALTSCRRMLKTFADSVFSSQATPYIYGKNKKMDVSEEKYINRIWAFIDKELDSEARKKFLKSKVEDLGHRVEAIYNITNKGIHNEINQLDVNMCIIDTYLLLGGLLQMKK
ncbi:MAG: hypothetical protein P9M13_03635 [Candidatus Ancaeobacter aquaticus]|nr:hypothetical protein [Candidatus Ancaeobacter aquaticus]